MLSDALVSKQGPVRKKFPHLNRDEQAHINLHGVNQFPLIFAGRPALLFANRNFLKRQAAFAAEAGSSRMRSTTSGANTLDGPGNTEPGGRRHWRAAFATKLSARWI